jgi:hypothetical protein
LLGDPSPGRRMRICNANQGNRERDARDEMKGRSDRGAILK